MKTIATDDAEELYEAINGDDGQLLGDEGATAGPWTVLGSSQTDQGRWHDRYWLVLADQAGDTWGLRYGIGLTENQEDDLPWEDHDGPLQLTRLYPHEVTRVEYRTTPA